MIAVLAALTAVSCAAVPLVLLVHHDENAHIVATIGTIAGLAAGVLGWAS